MSTPLITPGTFSGLNSIDLNSGIFDLVQFNPETMQMEMKYNAVLTPEEKAAKNNLVGLLVDPVTGEVAPDETQYALMDIAAALSGSPGSFIKGQNKPSYKEVNGEIVPTDETITIDQFYAATDGLTGSDYLNAVNQLPPVTNLTLQQQRDLKRDQGLAVVKRQNDRDKRSLQRNLTNIGRGVDLFTGGTGIGTAIGASLGGADVDDALKEGFKTAGVYAAGSNALDAAYNVANPETAMAEAAKAAPPKTVAGTAKENISKGIGTVASGAKDVLDMITPEGSTEEGGIINTITTGAKAVGDFVEDEVKGLGEAVGIDKEKRDDIREDLSDAGDTVKEVVAGEDGKIGIPSLLAGAGGALLLDQLLNQDSSADNYNQFLTEYEQAKPNFTGFAPIGAAIPRVGLPVQGFAAGGLNDLVPFQAHGQISGPGTGTSDSIPAYLSDGEFVMTAKAVEGLGNGDKNKGAAKMYAMMDKFESMA